MSPLNPISRGRPSRLVQVPTLLAVLLILAPLARASAPERIPYRGPEAPDFIVVGTMPENYLPGLMEIVQTALKRSPTMIVQQLQIAQADASLLSADSALYPQLSAGGTYGLASETVGEAGQFGAAGSHSTGNSTSESYSVSAGMPVFRWGQVWNGIRIQRLSLLISRKAYAEAYRTFVLQLRDSYLGLVSKKIGLRNADLNQKTAEDTLAVAEGNYKNGMISSGALSIPRLAVEDAHLARDRLAEDYAHSKRVLAQLAGIADITDDSVPDELPQVTYASATADAVLAAFLRDGAKSTFQAQNMQMAIHQAKLNYDIQITRQLPQFSGYYSFSAADTTSIALAQSQPGQPAIPASIAKVGETSIGYGISAGWDIFDGFATNAAIRSAKVGRRMAERNLQTYLETTLEQGQNTRRQLDLIARAMALAEERYDLAASALAQTEADFKYGSVPKSVVDGAKASVYFAEQARLTARADFLSHWSSFVSLVGADPALGQLPIQYVRATR